MATYEIVGLGIAYLLGCLFAFVACLTASASTPLHFPWEKEKCLKSFGSLAWRLLVWPVFMVVNIMNMLFFGIALFVVLRALYYMESLTGMKFGWKSFSKYLSRLPA